MTSVGISLFGVVANCISEKSGHSFGEAYGYGYNYDYGTGDEEEGPVEGSVVVEEGDEEFPAIDFEGFQDEPSHEEPLPHTTLLTPRRVA